MQEEAHEKVLYTFLTKIDLFILERESMQGEGQKEREREYQASRLCAEHGAYCMA